MYTLKKMSFALANFERLLHKCLLYGICLILGHILKNYTIGGTRPSYLDWLANYLTIGLILKESLYILECLSALKGFILKWLLKKLKNPYGVFTNEAQEKNTSISENKNNENEN
jgi:hypothetical protein